MKTVIIAEKPSVGRELSKVIGKNIKRNKDYHEGDDYIFTWGYGHLLGLPNPDFYNKKYSKWRLEDLPFNITAHNFIPSKGKKKQIDLIKKLIDRDDVSDVINACDGDREGELIFRLIYKYSKSNKPVKRLWISSLEEPEIKRAFKNLKPSEEYDGLYQEALTRSIADWVIGMNLSRLYTLKLNETFSVGRVQTPTLAFVVNREKEIKNFVPDDYYEIEGSIDGIKSKFFIGEDTKNTKMTDKDKANYYFNQINNSKESLKIIEYQKERKTKTAPKLFALGTLQGSANKHFGYSPKETLDIAQKLYEKKITTYPRTDSPYIMEEQIGSLVSAVLNLDLSEEEQNHITDNLVNSKTVNDAKVKAHHGIMITNTRPSLANKKEENIYKLIRERCLMQLAPQHESDNVSAISSTDDGNKFYSKGKTTAVIGWKFFSRSTSKEVLCPNHWKKGESVTLTDLELAEKQTKPPSRFNGKTLQEEMDKYNIGTSATQGGIIETLKIRSYIKKKGKVLYPQPKGILLIDIVNEALTTPETTEIMETELKKIEKSEQTKKAYLKRIDNFTSKIVEVEKNTNRAEERAEIKEEKVIGKCPLCGSPVMENKGDFFCSAPKEKCSFALWKNDKFWKNFNKTITLNRAEKILKNGKVLVKGLKSKKGSTFSAYLVLKTTPQKKWDYQWELEFKKGKKRK